MVEQSVKEVARNYNKSEIVELTINHTGVARSIIVSFFLQIPRDISKDAPSTLKVLDKSFRSLVTVAKELKRKRRIIWSFSEVASSILLRNGADA